MENTRGFGKRAIALLTPVSNESSEQIIELERRVSNVSAELDARGYRLLHFYLNDGAPNLDPLSPMLVRRRTRVGLATTLVEGYEAVHRNLCRDDRPGIVVRCDADGEHDPGRILQIVDAFTDTKAQGIVLPVWYVVAGGERPMQSRVARIMIEFLRALNLRTESEEEFVGSVYNNTFPMGFQAWRSDALAQVASFLRASLDSYSALYHDEVPSWGFDLLALLIGSTLFPGEIDYLFGGWSNPRTERRSPEKAAEQALRAIRMIDLFRRLDIS